MSLLVQLRRQLVTVINAARRPTCEMPDRSEKHHNYPADTSFRLIQTREDHCGPEGNTSTCKSPRPLKSGTIDSLLEMMELTEIGLPLLRPPTESGALRKLSELSVIATAGYRRSKV